MTTTAHFDLTRARTCKTALHHLSRAFLIASIVATLLVGSRSLALPSTTIAWAPSTLDVELVAGDAKTLQVSFTAETDITGAAIELVPALGPIVTVVPSTLGFVAGGSTVSVAVQVSAPYDSEPQRLDGTLHVRTSRRTLARPLPISVQVLGRFGAPSGVAVGPTGGIVSGSAGTVLTVPEGALASDTLLLVGPIVQASLPVSLSSDLSFVGGAYIEAGGPSLTTPAELAIPAPPDLGIGDQFLVATPIHVQGDYRLRFVDIAEPTGPSLLTQQALGLPFPFPGITTDGIFAFLKPLQPVGFVGGSVTRGGVAVAGAVITITSLPLFVCVTDQQGRYIIPGVVGAFTLNVFDPDTGAVASRNGQIPVMGGGITADVSLTTPTIKPGALVDGSFEQSACQSLGAWHVAGSAQAVAGLGTDPLGGAVINPTERACMAMITTGGLSTGGASSAISQTFTIPSDKTTLLFDYNFVTEEFPEFVGTIFNDSFRAVLRRSNGDEIQVAYEDVNSSAFVPVGGIDFPGGDSTTGMTGWRIAAFNVTSLAGTDELVTFSITDAGDTIYDSVVLIDNVRLSGGDLGFPFKFPLQESGPYTVSINSAFDHSSDADAFYPDNNEVVAYNEESGHLDPADPQRKFRDKVWDTHYGYRNSQGTVFSLGGQYTAGCTADEKVIAADPGPDWVFGTKDDTTASLLCRTFLYYDGHPGYDYRAGEGVNVYPVAPGTVRTEGCDRLVVTHQDGYETVYMHMSDRVTSGLVTTDTVIGKTSGIGSDCSKQWAPHLHFEVYRKGVKVDPYGWKGYWGDPYFQGRSGRTSVDVWARPQ